LGHQVSDPLLKGTRRNFRIDMKIIGLHPGQPRFVQKSRSLKMEILDFE